jgi:hypothetical protein
VELSHRRKVEDSEEEALIDLEGKKNFNIYNSLLSEYGV